MPGVRVGRRAPGVAWVVVQDDDRSQTVLHIQPPGGQHPLAPVGAEGVPDAGGVLDQQRGEVL